MINSIDNAGEHMRVSVEEALDFVRPAYEGRAYHNMSHVVHMMSRVEVLSLSARLPSIDTELILIATAFHDVVYHPGSNWNEDASAFVAGKWLEGRLCSALIDVVQQLIMMTKTHEVTAVYATEQYGAIICDADLWTIGSHWDEYKRHGAAIRQEFVLIDDHTFDNRRARVRQSLLARQRGQTPRGMEREAQAQANMRRELSEILTRYNLK